MNRELCPEIDKIALVISSIAGAPTKETVPRNRTE
jgi:hypothetical protein